MKLPSKLYETVATGLPNAFPYTHDALPTARRFTVTIRAMVGSAVVVKRWLAVLVSGGVFGVDRAATSSRGRLPVRSRRTCDRSERRSGRCAESTGRSPDRRPSILCGPRRWSPHRELSPAITQAGHDPGVRRANREVGGVVTDPRRPERQIRGPTAPGAQLSKLLPQTVVVVSIAELIVRIRRALLDGRARARFQLLAYQRETVLQPVRAC